MKILLHKNGFEAGMLELTQEDFDIYREARINCMLDKKPEDAEKYPDLVKIQRAIREGNINWEDDFESSFSAFPTCYFVIQKILPGGQRVIAGMAETDYRIEKKCLVAELRGGHIINGDGSPTESFRRLGLGKDLWDIRIRQAQDAGARKIVTQILSENTFSWKIAEKNQFSMKAERDNPFHPQMGATRLYELWL